ncbi:hypothetical protein EPO34_01450 [Patescibacteria group bacterium]|nr:MAG: hypothetical protein EPO34_01450 [Patescibacteria group bacterium]
MQKAQSSHALRVAGFFVILYALCLIWQMWSTDPAVQEFHLTSLKFLFPGFTGFALPSIIVGALWSFAYGFAGSLVFHAFHENGCAPKK